MENSYITPYKYRYTLGKDNPRTISGNHIVMHNGDRMEISSSSVEFMSEVKLTWSEFFDKVKGTEGISGVYGEFKDDDKLYRQLIRTYDLLVEELYKHDYADWNIEQTLKSEINRIRLELNLGESYAK